MENQRQICELRTFAESLTRGEHKHFHRLSSSSLKVAPEKPSNSPKLHY